ncbi:DUF1328 domain-containing protein [bacterium]|nr:DUF1328 domain-containing protein [bacterium]
MSTWAALFLLLALVSGLLGFAGLGAAEAPLARLLFNLFLILFLVAVFVRNVWQSGAFQAWRDDD